jgi:hypothetical protein
MNWRDLKSDPPTGEEYCILLRSGDQTSNLANSYFVILFPCKTDCGLLLYITSNPQFAIINGFNQGFTHWCEVELAPTHNQWQEWQDKLNEK